jgi:hypothetical protein
MARKSSVAAWSLLFVSCFAARSGVAGSVDPRTLRDQLEDQVIDGDKDVEDLAIFHVPTSTSPRVRWSSPTYFAVAAFAGSHADGQREVGALFVLTLPLDHLFHGGKSGPVLAASLDAPLADAGWVDRVEPFVPRGLAEGAGAPSDRPSEGSVLLTTDVARNCVRAAWRAIGVGDDAAIDSMASRARTSAALPELRLRVMRTIDESGRVTLTDTDPSRYTEAGAATNFLEARLTFRLDRLLFADEEVHLERVRIDRSELRARTAAKVLQALFEWQRAYALLADPSLPSADHFAAELRELEASALLDVMTDGWFGRYRAALGSRQR